ncbi:MAG TPA: acyl-CoA dehydrogenase family protein [Solirubrobacteraceae bacterium]|jgi:alkylation response protein AidB-like acyl-CoA dehydrogenase|nr:acyl-CoA dehydrogenase family protein [Solirubrobacteraceae bacterium]
MDFGLSDDQRDIKRTARDLLSERARPERVRELAEAGRSDEQLWRELSDLGWPGIAIAEEHGGQGLGCIELTILCEELGRAVAAVPFLSSVTAAAMIEHAGSPEQRGRWLPGLASGEATGALAAGDDGGAELVIGGVEASVIVLVADDGTARALTPDDCEITPVASIDPTRSTARVSASADAGEELGGDASGGLDRALVAISSELVGVCDRAVEMTVAYVKERHQFGVPVGAFQAVSHRCAQMLLDTEKARSTTAFAAWTADADPEHLAEAAAMAKASAADAGREVTASAIQAHGGIGFTWEADVHWLFKRAQLDAALLGGASSQRARLAEILGERAARVGAARAR